LVQEYLRIPGRKNALFCRKLEIESAGNPNGRHDEEDAQGPVAVTDQEPARRRPNQSAKSADQTVRSRAPLREPPPRQQTLPLDSKTPGLLWMAHALEHAYKLLERLRPKIPADMCCGLACQPQFAQSCFDRSTAGKAVVAKAVEMDDVSKAIRM